MSQLTNRRSSRKNRNKDIFIFNVIFSTILICLIFIIVTILAISNKKNNIPENSEEKPKISELQNDGIPAVKLTDKYYQNDLKKYERTYEANYYSYVDENGNIEDMPKIDIKYHQIDGLVDKTLENKINEEIKETVFSMYTEDMLQNDSIKKIYIDTYVLANYADVLSIEIMINILDIDDTYSYTNSKFLNYALTTGEKINFKDMFTYNTAIKPIIASSAYSNFAWDYHKNDEDGAYNDMNKVDYSNIENRVYNVVKTYENTKEINFGFNEKYIFIILDKNRINIDMSKFYDNIAIYNRYKTYEKIYEYENVGIKNIFVFSSRVSENYYSLIEDKENYYIDVLMYAEETIPEEFLEQQKQKLQTRISEIRSMSKENLNKGILYAGYMYIGMDSNANEIYVSNELGRYEMQIDYYKKTFYNKIGEQARQDKVDMSYYIQYDESYVTYIYEIEYSKYNLTTFEKIEED